MTSNDTVFSPESARRSTGGGEPATLFCRSDTVALYTGDAAGVVGVLADASVDCVVTSPPYWGLRDYRIPGQYGIEPAVGEYVDALVAVFDGLARVLTQSGSMWLNLGDSFGGSWGNYVAAGSTARTASTRAELRYGTHRPPQARYRAKDLVGVPWRVVFALQERGWVLRNAVVWAKPNARPESARDRLSQRYEMVFCLTRHDGYGFCSQNAAGSAGDVWSVAADRAGTTHRAAGTVEIARRCLTHSCPPGGVVLDPFSGSGTTGIAAREVGARFIGIDIDPTCHVVAWPRLTERGGRDE